ncbi:hypothetical protein NM688_g5647 [Phlebia brevispora]|uniref:Uncharacterized protein n=1 Tax=Phlebia brevispora TaxID=194682 RepID=A0ACC1SRV3_9APHY|nr:hypothetical protein NM688_g5647 [Phlebia brevispora]
MRVHFELSEPGVFTLRSKPSSQMSKRTSDHKEIVAHLREMQDALPAKREFASDHIVAISFVVLPGSSPPPSKDKNSPKELNTGFYALRYDAPVNNDILTYEEWLLEVLLLARQAEELLMEIEHWKEAEWRRQAQLRGDISTVDASRATSRHRYFDTDVLLLVEERYIRPITLRLTPRLLLIYLLVSGLHLLCSVSIVRCHFVLEVQKALFQTPDGTDVQSIASDIPSDVRAVIATLELSPKTVTYVCCPRCCALYILSSSTDENQYPDLCEERNAKDSPPCNAKLRVHRRVHGVERTFPARRFRVQDFDDWLGRMLCRPDIESVMDNSASSTEGSMADIRDAPLLKDITLPNGEKFLHAHVKEGRYIFSICIDGLNPRGKGGPPGSVCSIFLACLNLPPNMRFKQENMYLAAVVPGPHHPSKEQINHLIRPIVTSFHNSYLHGVRYSQTPNFPHGKMTRSALVLPVGDALAYAQLTGHAPPTHTHFCPFCNLTADNIEDLDWRHWPSRTCEQHRHIATSWLLAETVEERANIYKTHGIRWTELLRLPYWDPMKLRSIDIMHNLFSGVLKHHIADVWGISSDISDGLEGITFDPSKKRVSAKDQDIARRILVSGSNTELRELLKPALRQLCKEKGLRFSGKKGKLIKRLIQLRVERGWPEHSDAAEVADPQTRDPEAGRGISNLRKTGEFGTEDESSEEDREAEESVAAYDFSPSKSRRNRPVTEEEMKDARLILSSGTKSKLTALRLPVLKALCVETFNKSLSYYEKSSKDVILSYLHGYRVQQGICDENGRLLQRGNRAMTQVDADKVAEAEVVLEYGTKTRLKRLRVAQIVALCTVRLGKRYLNKKQALHDLHDYRVRKGITDARGKLAENRRRKARTRIIGKTRLTAVWKDMNRVELPSTVTPVPSTIGTKAQANLSAAEWRTFCTINLPITLISLWGCKPLDSREYQLLKNFIDLVTAVKLASARVVTAESLAKYQQYMHGYLSDLLELFPGCTILYNQHKALHIQEVFEYVGPAHVQWCFGFEHGNHELQVINTNNRHCEFLQFVQGFVTRLSDRFIDDIASTFLERFCNKQNIRHIFFNSNLLSQRFPAVVSAFKKAFGSDIESEQIDDLMTLSCPDDVVEATLSRDTSTLLQQKISTIDGCQLPSAEHVFNRLVQIPGYLDVEDSRYKAESEAPGDSNIAFRTSPGSRWRAGRIQQIFRHIRRKPDGVRVLETFVTVIEYKPLDIGEKPHDPYRSFPLSGKLFRDVYLEQPVIVRPSEIWCHCTVCKVDLVSPVLKGNYLHVLPIYKW